MSNEIKVWMQSEFRKDFCLFLPNGCFGRPFDNSHAVDEYVLNEIGLRVVIDETICIEIVGNQLVSEIVRETVGSGELIITGFDEVILTYLDSNGASKTERFPEGGRVGFYGYPQINAPSKS